jgi:ribonucleotide reductase beta subunit family protein with ferritin-like domain
MDTHESGTIIHISRSRDDLVTVTNHHPTASKCIVSLVPHMALQKRAESMGLLEPEPLLHPSNDPFVTYPIHHHDLWAMHKNHFASLWSPEEIDLKGDRDDFDNELTDNERNFIKHVLAFFAASNGIINKNLPFNFSSEIQVTEARCFYHFQMAMENVHAETYSLLIDAYVTDSHEKNKLLHALEHFDCIKKKADWALQWCNREFASFSERCVAFSAVEGIFFSGSFCAIYWLRQKGLRQGLRLQRTHCQRQRPPHRVCLSHLQQTGEQTYPTANRPDHPRCSRDRKGIHINSIASLATRHERDY